MNKNKRNKGITLIALIVTIIVLLILAGISISMLVGDNGIINHANTVKKDTEIADEKEIVENAVIKAIEKNRFGILKKETLQEQINIYTTEEKKVEVMEDSQNLLAYFPESGRYYNIDEKGNITILEIIKDNTPGDIMKDKDGNELDGVEKPFEIWSIEDLVAFSKSVTDKTNNYEDKTIKLMKNLDFKSIFSYTNPRMKEFDIYLDGDGTTELKEQLSEKGKGFMPIGFLSGANYGFKGVFEGNNNTIKNIYINKEYEANQTYLTGGLFALNLY